MNLRCFSINCNILSLWIPDLSKIACINSTASMKHPLMCLAIDLLLLPMRTAIECCMIMVYAQNMLFIYYIYYSQLTLWIYSSAISFFPSLWQLLFIRPMGLPYSHKPSGLSQPGRRFLEPWGRYNISAPRFHLATPAGMRSQLVRQSVVWVCVTSLRRADIRAGTMETLPHTHC